MDTNRPIINTQSLLNQARKDLEQENTIAVDLESDSMFHFLEKVCLIQIASMKNAYIFDPLSDIDFTALKTVFESTRIRKVFHGADYDVRSLFRDFGFEINNLFDTQLACRYLGLKETSLEAVLYTFFQVTLNKKFQKKDWSQRPLPDEMIEYAANDVAYLIPLAKILEDDLIRLGRLSWVMEDCANLSQVRPASLNQHPLFLSYKGAGALPPKHLVVLEAVLQLRKKIAMQKDKPLFKIFQNKAIDKIVREKPVTLNQLKGLNLFSPSQFEMYGNMVVETVNAVLTEPGSSLPVYPRTRTRSLKVSEQNRIKVLKEWRDKKAEELDIDPSLVLNKALITAIAIRKPATPSDLEEIKEMKKWQFQEFGAHIMNLLKK